MKNSKSKKSRDSVEFYGEENLHPNILWIPQDPGMVKLGNKLRMRSEKHNTNKIVSQKQRRSDASWVERYTSSKELRTEDYNINNMRLITMGDVFPC